MSFADIRRRALELEQNMLDATQTEFEGWGNDAAQQMQSDAPWQDQTGDARRGLKSVVIETLDAAQRGRLALVHSVDYGKFLELARGGKYAIIMPTLASMGPQLVARFRRIWK